jgi:protein-tyrosine phosphatase
MTDAIELCAALVEDGVTTVVATPHQLGRYDRLNTASLVRQTLSVLIEELASRNIPLELFAGADVRIDERIVRLLEADEVLAVGPSGKHLLLEFPHETFVDPSPIIEALADFGIQTIITHPERHAFLTGSTRRLIKTSLKRIRRFRHRIKCIAKRHRTA